jgi:hypothetical protein
LVNGDSDTFELAIALSEIMAINSIVATMLSKALNFTG